MEVTRWPSGEMLRKCTNVYPQRQKQIRTAQQTYRHRKEATIVSLENGGRKLKETLQKLTELFSNFTDFARKSKLSQREVEVGQRLQFLDNQFRSLMDKLNKDDGNRDRQGPSSATGIDTGLSGSSYSSIKRKDMKISPKETYLNFPELEHTPSHTSSPAHGPIRTISSLILFQPHLEESRNFAARLNRESLQRGYRLVTTPGTPLPAPCPAFRYCIFSNTRQSIIRKLENLLRKPPGKEDSFPPRRR